MKLYHMQLVKLLVQDWNPLCLNAPTPPLLVAHPHTMPEWSVKV